MQVKKDNSFSTLAQLFAEQIFLQSNSQCFFFMGEVLVKFKVLHLKNLKYKFLVYRWFHIKENVLKAGLISKNNGIRAV